MFSMGETIMTNLFRAVLIGLAVVFVLPLGGCQITQLNRSGIAPPNANVSDELVCYNAVTSEGNWEHLTKWSRWVNEAKSRGLTITRVAG